MTKYGWHANKLTAYDVTIDNDLTITGDLSFGDATTDTFTCTGTATFGSSGSGVDVTMYGATAAKMAQWDASDNAFEITSLSSSNGALYISIGGRTAVATGYEKMMYLSGTLDSTGSSGGVKTRGFEIDLERTTATVANGDSRDQAFKITIKDSVGDHAAGYFIRAMDIKSELDAGGTTLTALYCANFTAEVDNGTATDYTNVSFNSKVDGVVTNDCVNVRIYDESQGTVSGDHIGLQFATKNVAPATGQRDHVIEVSCADSIGWKNLFHFTDATGGTTTVDTDAKVDTDGGDSDGAIRIDVGGTAYYIPFFAAADVSNSW